MIDPRTPLLIGMLLVTLQCGPAPGTDQPPVDILLLGGRVLDGAGNPWVHQDIGITGDRIVFTGKARDMGVHARDTIDVSGLLVTPGFWDAHNHAALDQPHGRAAVPLLFQGFTTVVQGVDGGGRNDLDEIFAAYERDGVAVNVVRFVGHNAARREAMGSNFDRPATPDEIEHMKAYIAQGMEQGAVGFSTGLAYNPGYFSTTEEVVELNRVAGRYGGVYDTHERDVGVTHPGVGFLNAVKEAIEIAERGRTPLIFSHINALGPVAHAQFPEALAEIEAARARGVNIVGAQHAYTATQGTIQGHLTPRWAGVGGVDSLIARFSDPELREQIDRDVATIMSLRGGPGKIIITSPIPENGSSIARLAAEWGVSAPEVVRRLLLEHGPGVMDMNIDIARLDYIHTLAQLDWVMVCTDGFTPERLEGVSHPRSFGAATYKLRALVQEEGVVTMPYAIRSMTSLPAQFYGIPDRGLLKPGFFADIVVLAEARIRDRATYEDPFQYSEGTVHVLVNGEFAFRDGQPTGALPGRPVRRGGG